VYTFEVRPTIDVLHLCSDSIHNIQKWHHPLEKGSVFFSSVVIENRNEKKGNLPCFHDGVTSPEQLHSIILSSI